MFIALLGDGGALESEKTYGRFNRDLAIKRAERQGRDDLVIINGDDRKEFLGPFGPEVLYWWELMDANNLIYFFAGKLDKNNHASCDETPAATARGSSTDGSSSERPSKKSKASRESIQREMNENVARMQKSVAAGVSAQIAAQLERMEGEELHLEDAIDELDPNDANEERRRQRLTKRLHSLRMRKLELEVQLESVSSALSQQLTY
jgi:hypothetical protein